MPLVINGLGGGHTHTYRHTNQNSFKKPDVRSLWPCTPGLKIKDVVTLQAGASNQITPLVLDMYCIADNLLILNNVLLHVFVDHIHIIIKFILSCI